MPHIDESSGDVVTRIVYDGLPEAGKTTNIQCIRAQLGEERAGVLHSPGTSQRQTEFFDWLEFSGGLIDGRRVRCQLVSVPGQKDKRTRREHILESADVVVFVADARPERIAENQEALAGTLQLLRQSQTRIALLVQANKQDVVDCLKAGELGRQLSLESSVPVVAATSATGEGVMYTLVMAARIAIDRARVLISHGEVSLVSTEENTAASLLNAMLAAEDATRRRAAEDCPAQPNSAEATDAAAGFQSEMPPLPDAARIATGHIWPPSTGRAYLNSAMQGSQRVHSAMLTGCEVLTLSSSEGWQLQTLPEDVFDSDAEAHTELMNSAKDCLKNPDWVDHELALIVFPDRERWRVWTLVRTRPTLMQRLLEASDNKSARAVLEAAQRVDRLRELRPPVGEFANRVSLETTAECDGEPRLQLIRYRHGMSAESSLYEDALAIRKEL